MLALERYRDPAFLRLPAARRLGLLLGLPRDASPTELALAAEVSRGLAVNAVDHLIDLLGRSAVVGPIIPQTTYRRAVKSKTPLSRDLGDRIVGVSRVVDPVARIYHGDRGLMRDFLRGPHMLLEGKSPWELAASSVTGASAVLEMVEQAEAGFAV